MAIYIGRKQTKLGLELPDRDTVLIKQIYKIRYIMIRYRWHVGVMPLFGNH